MSKKKIKKEEKLVQDIIKEYAETWSALDAYDKKNDGDADVSKHKN